MVESFSPWLAVGTSIPKATWRWLRFPDPGRWAGVGSARRVLARLVSPESPAAAPSLQHPPPTSAHLIAAHQTCLLWLADPPARWADKAGSRGDQAANALRAIRRLRAASRRCRPDVFLLRRNIETQPKRLNKRPSCGLSASLVMRNIPKSSTADTLATDAQEIGRRPRDAAKRQPLRSIGWNGRRVVCQAGRAAAAEKSILQVKPHGLLRTSQIARCLHVLPFFDFSAHRQLFVVFDRSRFQTPSIGSQTRPKISPFFCQENHTGMLYAPCFSIKGSGRGLCRVLLV
ncbi:hypothetical protein BDY21DRAFT_212565 [Lineolata rhizophorae]|uniref:Uncharacterized protein n=1 Tax=Lineolata rhizophorae TaxID=578093 RepID=A0A6A6P509_9PEZI|nr:hypothetical protein BDY21DRAFT_212565 [Lineolata rhizophorae]